MLTEAGLPGWFPEDFSADPELLAALMGEPPAGPDDAGTITAQLAAPLLILRVSDADGPLGTVTLENGRLAGSSDSMQRTADAAVRRAGGDPAAAFRALDGWSNGYVWARSATDTIGGQVSLAFDEALHPRGRGGKWAKKAGPSGVLPASQRFGGGTSPGQARYRELVKQGKPLMEALRIVQEEQARQLSPGAWQPGAHARDNKAKGWPSEYNREQREHEEQQQRERGKAAAKAAQLWQRQHDNRRAAGQTWTADAQGGIIRHAHPRGAPGGWKFIRSGNREVTEPRVGDEARMPLGGNQNQVGTVVSVGGGHAVIDSADDDMRYLVDWRSGGRVVRKAPLSEAAAAASLLPARRPSAPAVRRPPAAASGAAADYGHDSGPVRDLAAVTVADLAEGSSEHPSQGVQGRVEIVTLPDGRKVVHKEYKSHYVRMADVDELAYYVSQVTGAGSPPVARPPDAAPGEIIEGYVPGTTASRWADNSGGETEGDLQDSPQGEKIGLLDYLLANSDRHDENWMVTPDGEPVPIDNSGGWYAHSFGTSSDFWHNAPVDGAEHDRISDGLAALEPEFARLGHQDWYRQMMSRWSAVYHFSNVDMGWRYDPLEHRNKHGEWSRGGDSSTVPSSGMKWSGEGSPYRDPPADRTAQNKAKASANPFIRKYGLSAANVLAAYDASTPDERAQGMRWYSDAHDVALAIGNGDAGKGAAMLSAFSPQTDWATDVMNAAHTLASGQVPEHGVGITGTVRAKAEAITAASDAELAGLFPEQGSLKTRSFYKLIRNGGDLPGDQDGEVVIDRHALSVAAGRRLTKQETEAPTYAEIAADHPEWTPAQARAYKATFPADPTGAPYTYQHISDMYRTAAKRASERDGIPISPHQMQAITWMHQLSSNDADAAQLLELAAEAVRNGGKVGSIPGAVTAKGQIALKAKAWATWSAYAAAHHIPVHKGTTTMAGTIGAQLDLGWHDAWRHEERGPTGEWLHGGAEAEIKYTAGELSAQIGKLRGSKDIPADLRDKLRQAQVALRRGDNPEAANHLIDVLNDPRLKEPAVTRIRIIAASIAEPPPPPRPPDDAELGRISDTIGRLHDDALAHRRDEEAIHLRDAVGALELHRDPATAARYPLAAAAQRLLKAAAAAEHDYPGAGGRSRAKQYRALAEQLSPGAVMPPSPEIAAVKAFLDQHAAGVPGMFGPGLALAWDRQAPTEYQQRDKPSYLAQIDWQGHMSISDDAARRLRDATVPGSGTIEDPDAITVPLHEMVHAVEPEADIAGQVSRKANERAYQDPAGQAIEEGFTQLGTAQHAGEFFAAAGVADRVTEFHKPEADSYAGSGAQKEVRHKVADILRRLADPALPHDQAVAMKAGQLLTALRRDIMTGDPQGARENLAAFRHTGWPEFSGDADQLAAQISAYETAVRGARYTAGEYAAKMAEPGVILGGTSWPHYATWTADAQKFSETIAELGGHFGDQNEVRRVADAVNAVGAAKKMRVMAELTMVASGADRMTPPLTPAEREQALVIAERSIREQWQKAGPDAAVSAAAKAFKTTVVNMRMAEAGMTG